MLALVVGALGLYGLLSYAVELRTREMGIRIALGARRGHAAGLVVRQGVALALAGVVGGALVASFATRMMRGLLYAVSPQDPRTFVVVALVLLAVALAASALPALRIMRMHPTSLLRGE